MGSASGSVGVDVPRVLVRCQDVGSWENIGSLGRTEAGRFIGMADRLNWSQTIRP